MSVSLADCRSVSASDCDTMTAKPAVDEIRLSRVLLLLAVSVFINYLDRSNLSIAAPLLKNEFQLSATQLGVLLSSFFWTYSFFLPVSGWLVDRLDVIAGGFFLWSAANQLIRHARRNDITFFARGKCRLTGGSA